MKELILFIISIITLLTASICYSYRFQKNFTNFTKPVKLLVGILSFMIILILSIYSLVILDVFNYSGNFFFFLHDSHPKKSLRNTATISLISLVNVFVFMILPFIIFYFAEEKKNLEENDNENDVEDLLPGENKININSCKNYSNESVISMNLFKNYFYYLIAYACFNIISIVIFKMSYFDPSKNLMRYSVVPDGMRKYSHLYSDFEILAYINFGVLVSISKLLYLIYVPYGCGKITSLLIENLKGEINMKKEYSNLNHNFSKNYETIKNITSQKLMTGRPLSKKEKMILKSCKETDTVLHHKQEVLEDKFSNLERFLFYFYFPFKFLLIFITLTIGVFFTISKIGILHNQIQNSTCGKDCGYLANTNLSTISIQTLLMQFNDVGKIISFTLIFIYLLSAIVISVRKIGIINILPWKTSITTSEIRLNKILSITLYSLIFSLTIVALFEVFSVTPDFSFFHNSYLKCDIYNLEAHHCSISLFGIFVLKLYVNFAVFKFIDLIFSGSFACLVILLLIYLPIKSVLKYWRSEQEEPSY